MIRRTDGCGVGRGRWTTVVEWSGGGATCGHRRSDNRGSVAWWSTGSGSAGVRRVIGVSGIRGVRRWVTRRDAGMGR